MWWPSSEQLLKQFYASVIKNPGYHQQAISQCIGQLNNICLVVLLLHIYPSFAVVGETIHAISTPDIKSGICMLSRLRFFVAVWLNRGKSVWCDCDRLEFCGHWNLNRWIKILCRNFVTTYFRIREDKPRNLRRNCLEERAPSLTPLKAKLH